MHSPNTDISLHICVIARRMISSHEFASELQQHNFVQQPWHRPLQDLQWGQVAFNIIIPLQHSELVDTSCIARLGLYSVCKIFELCNGTFPLRTDLFILWPPYHNTTLQYKRTSCLPWRPASRLLPMASLCWWALPTNSNQLSRRVRSRILWWLWRMIKTFAWILLTSSLPSENTSLNKVLSLKSTTAQWHNAAHRESHSWLARLPITPMWPMLSLPMVGTANLSNRVSTVNGCLRGFNRMATTLTTLAS